MKSLFSARGARAVVVFFSMAAFSAAAATSAQGSWLSAGQVRALLSDKGYRQITDLDIDNGIWEADATDANGRRVEVLVDPRDGRILSDTTPVILGTAAIQQKLAEAGYTRVRDLEFDHGVWQAEAHGPKGFPVEVTLDARTGEVLHVEQDWLD